MQVGQRVGPFDIQKQLGSGAMGSVYLARYRKTGDRVAIKVMLAGLGGNETALARFQREASVLKQLNHPNIVHFYAAGEFEGAPYYAMEYIQGEPLDRLLERGDRLTWEKVVEIGKQVCAALKHAHDQGIIHRDLKPSNLMILPDGTVKLTDFGIAKDLDVTQLTSANCTVGTAAYMSPEQCKGERNLTHKSDLYSLGVVLYELLVGRKPFVAETTMDMFLLHVQGTFERPARIVLDIPVWLDNIVCQLLEKKPEHRPFDAGIVGDALDKVAEKVAAQQSAGMERAKARIVDRAFRDKRIDETDRKAAATLRTGVGRSRKKRRSRPFYTRAWFQLIAISGLLLAIGAVIYQAFRPANADLLYRQAKLAAESGDIDAMREARKGTVADYLKYYGHLTDDRTAQVRQWALDMDVRILETALVNRRKRFDPKDRGEELYRSGLDQEEKGSLSEARKKWQELAALDDKDCEDLTAYHNIARQRLAWIEEAFRKSEEIDQTAERVAQAEEDRPFDDERERHAVEAKRYALIKDFGMARRRWEELKRRTERNSLHRAWTLMAYQGLAGLPKEEFDDSERVGLVKKALEDATKLMSTSTKEASARLKEIITLYKNDHSEDLAKCVAEAKKKYEELTRGRPVVVP